MVFPPSMAVYHGPWWSLPPRLPRVAPLRPGHAAARAELHLAAAVGPEPRAAAQQGGLADAALADDQQGLTFD